VQHASVLKILFVSIFIFNGCNSQNSSFELNALSEAFRRPEYQGGGDGWGAARRRRMLLRYFEANGVMLNTITESRSDLDPHNKYRRVHLDTGPAGKKGAAVKRLTYVLDTGGQTQSLAAQQECDELFFQELKSWAKDRAEPLHLGMDFRCKQPPYGLTRQVREQM
jgi:hypothetical protein